MSTCAFMGYVISNRGLEGDVAVACDHVRGEGPGMFVACANPHSLVTAARDVHARSALMSADLLLPDGIGVVHAARLFGCSVPERVIGYDFFISLTKQLAAAGGGRYFFLGASDDVLQRITRRLAHEFPAITVSGSFAPPFSATFSEKDNRRMVAAINAARPDVLWVGMTAPKQEKWVLQHRHLLRVPCIGAIGAVFDFYSGVKRRPPLCWQRSGLEWLYRLCREPRRLWERTVISAPVFIGMVLAEWLRVKVSPKFPMSRHSCSHKQCHPET